MQSTIQDLLPLLERIAIAQERIAIAQERIAQIGGSEGFFNYGKKVYANLTKGNGDGWYVLKDDIAETQPSICRGWLVGISFPKMERRRQEVRKFHLVMNVAGETVTFESGYDCFFSKTILATFAIASPEVLARPIQLATYPKKLRTSDQTLAVSLRDSNGNKLPSEWSNDDDWSAIATAAIANVKAAVSSR
ncbi:MAG: hypothetical protein AB8B99_21795 [Phormidesmis sp.]